jgi:hypothetical protein
MSLTHGSNLRILALEKENEELRKHKKEKNDKYSHVVQMLILEYLGIAKGIQSNNKKADIYAPIIGRDWETTRQYFTRLNFQKNQKNLEILLDYFEKGGLPEQVELVKTDLGKIKQAK